MNEYKVGKYDQVKDVKKEIDRIKNVIDGVSNSDFLPKNYNNNNGN